MAPRQKVNLSYIHFTFEHNKGKSDETLNIIMRHDKPMLSNFIVSQRSWFMKIMTSEISKVPKDSQVTFSEWRFVSNKPDIFRVCNTRFDKVLIVLGEDTVYWSFYMDDPIASYMEGESDLPLKYCTCCLQEQYTDILNSIKEYIASQNMKPVLLNRFTNSRFEL